MRSSLKDELYGKYIICSCEGNAEQAAIDLLIYGNRLCFGKEDLMDGQCTQIRTGKHIAETFLSIEAERDIAILRILDRPKEKLVLPRIYRLGMNIPVFDVITRPEIEILHIIACNRYQDFKSQRELSASAYCKSLFAQGRNRPKIKSKEFMYQQYEEDLDSLVHAITEYKRLTDQQEYCLADLLAL